MIRPIFVIKDVLAVTMVDLVNFTTLFIVANLFFVAKAAETKYSVALSQFSQFNSISDLLKNLPLPQPQTTYAIVAILAFYFIMFLRRNLRVSKISLPRSITSVIVTTALVLLAQNFLATRNFRLVLPANPEFTFLLIATIRGIFYMLANTISPLSTVKPIKPVSSHDPANLLSQEVTPSPSFLEKLKTKTCKIAPILHDGVNYVAKITVLTTLFCYTLPATIPHLELPNRPLAITLVILLVTSILRVVLSVNLSMLARIDIALTVIAPILITFALHTALLPGLLGF